MVVILDNGHGNNTAGKRSPDERLLEWEYTRRVARAVAAGIDYKGVTPHILTPELADVSLDERCRRVSELCKKEGKDNVMLISIHCNAYGTSWNTAHGWAAYVHPDAGQRSRVLARELATAAAGEGLYVRREMAAAKYWTANFSILRETRCAAVLTENLFMTNIADVDYLLSDAGFASVVNLHLNAIYNYVDVYR